MMSIEGSEFLIGAAAQSAQPSLPSKFTKTIQFKFSEANGATAFATFNKLAPFIVGLNIKDDLEALSATVRDFPGAVATNQDDSFSSPKEAWQKLAPGSPHQRRLGILRDELVKKQLKLSFPAFQTRAHYVFIISAQINDYILVPLTIAKTDVHIANICNYCNATFSNPCLMLYTFIQSLFNQKYKIHFGDTRYPRDRKIIITPAYSNEGKSQVKGIRQEVAIDIYSINHNDDIQTANQLGCGDKPIFSFEAAFFIPLQAGYSIHPDSWSLTTHSQTHASILASIEHDVHMGELTKIRNALFEEIKATGKNPYTRAS